MEEYIAISKNIKISPRKVRLVADSVKKEKKLAVALAKLAVLNKRAAMPIKKTLESAQANAINNFQKDKNNLIVKDIIVEEGIAYKRYHFASRGRIHPYKKRTSHIKVVLGLTQTKPEVGLVKKESIKEGENIKDQKLNIKKKEGKKASSK